MILNLSSLIFLISKVTRIKNIILLFKKICILLLKLYNQIDNLL